MTKVTGRWNNSAAVWLAPVISGVLLVAAFPNFKYPVAAWVAIVPLLAVVRRSRPSPLATFLIGWIAGWIFFFFSSNWITFSMVRYGGMAKPLAYLATAVFCAITALFPGLFLGMLGYLERWWGLNAFFFAPPLWTATEWLRSVLTGISWNHLGISQVQYFEIAKFGQFGGVYLVGFILLAFNTLVLVLTEAFTREGRRVVAFLLLLGILGYFISKQNDGFFIGGLRASGAELTAAVVQPVLPVDPLKDSDDFSARNKESFDKTRQLLDSLLKSPEGGHPDLIVWPESPLVVEYGLDGGVTSTMNQIARDYRSYFIFSAIGRDGQKIYNSAQAVGPDGAALARYDKRRLMPFGEYVPLRFLLGHFVPPMIGDFNQGMTATVNTFKLMPRESFVVNEKETQGEVALQRTTSFVRTGTFICYEAAYPSVVSDLVRHGAGLLVNISDDAWFGESAGPRQHLDHVRMRAIENSRDIIRVTNSGLTALVRSDGSVENELPAFSPKAAVFRATEHKEITFYARYGDWFAVSCTSLIAIALAARLIGFVRKRSSK